MSNLFQSLGRQNPQPQNPAQMLQQVKADPAAFLRQHGFNIPQNVNLHDPNAIINSLMQSGQIPNNRYQQAMRMLQGMRRR